MSAASQLNISLLLVQQVLTRYDYPLIFLLGDFGNILNIFLFLRRRLRNTSCNIYFLASAFTNLVALNVGIISLLYVYEQPSAVTLTYCKTRNYVLNISQQASRFLIVLACFDRFALCSTSAGLRKVCQVHIALRYIIPSIIVIWMIIPLHIPISYSISKNTCIFPGMMVLYNGIYGITMAGLLPPGLMLTFSLLIYRNLKLKQIRRRQQIYPLVNNASVNPRIRRQQIKDQQALAMLLIQVVIYVSSTTLYTTNLMYTVLTMNDAANKSSERKAIETFASFIAGILVFVCPCLSFYSFTLASRLFRKELRLMMCHLCNGRWHWSCLTRSNRNDTTSNAVAAPNAITQPRMT
ncbi:unnamed protein product [Adineta ricciae]|uniref:G-protein coupled receptors family 1 profile domain-containing protein n=1 Tax=Adineta ricciae TaxID=249248 RepID=A0A814V287_ADIRI|nr:unnamed protein product [Adineta ricciae]